MNLNQKQTAQIVALMEQGKTLTIGEYRLCDSAPFDFMDKESGEKKTIKGVKHTIEVGNKAILMVDADIAKNPELSDKYVTPYKKGAQVIVCMASMGYQKGRGEVYRGTIVELTP